MILKFKRKNNTPHINNGHFLECSTITNDHFLNLKVCFGDFESLKSTPCINIGTPLNASTTNNDQSLNLKIGCDDFEILEKKQYPSHK